MKYEELFESFSWEKVIQTFDWSVHEKFNMAHECCDRWAEDPERIAVYWEDESGKTDVWTYKRMKEQSNRMANALRSLGVQKRGSCSGSPWKRDGAHYHGFSHLENRGCLCADVYSFWS